MKVCNSSLTLARVPPSSASFTPTPSRKLYSKPIFTPSPVAPASIDKKLVLRANEIDKVRVEKIEANLPQITSEAVFLPTTTTALAAESTNTSPVVADINVLPATSEEHESLNISDCLKHNTLTHHAEKDNINIGDESDSLLLHEAVPEPTSVVELDLAPRVLFDPATLEINHETLNKSSVAQTSNSEKKIKKRSTLLKRIADCNKAPAHSPSVVITTADIQTNERKLRPKRSYAMTDEGADKITKSDDHYGTDIGVSSRSKRKKSVDKAVVEHASTAHLSECKSNDLSVGEADAARQKSAGKQEQKKWDEDATKSALMVNLFSAKKESAAVSLHSHVVILSYFLILHCRVMLAYHTLHTLPSRNNWKMILACEYIVCFYPFCSFLS